MTAWLVQEFECEICGDQTYRGRREFERHFKEWRHQNGMRALGIPNNKNFYEITKIQEALELWQNIQVGALACELDSCAGWLIVGSSMQTQNIAVYILFVAHSEPLHLASRGTLRSMLASIIFAGDWKAFQRETISLLTI